MFDITNLNDLNAVYDEANNKDRALFAEMRTNIKIRNGEHYNTSARKIIEGFRNSGMIDKESKIRLTKNYAYSITDEYINSIVTRSGSIVASPFNKGDIRDTKKANMFNSVFEWFRQTNNYSSLREDLVNDFVVIGETYVVLRYDYDYGDIIGAAEDGTPVKSGRIVADVRYGFEAKRDPEAKSFDDCRYIIFDRYIDKTDAKKLLQDAGVNEGVLIDSTTKSALAYDYATGSYINDNSKCVFREMYVRPCSAYPNGKYILFNQNAICVFIDLPAGLFPVYQAGFAKITASPRSSSILRVIRPFQVEINRASSKMAEHQITIGDDKMIMYGGSKLTSNKVLDGVRMLNVDGQKVDVLQGRTGEQYLGYIQKEIEGMHDVAKVRYLLEDKQTQADPYTILYRSMKDKAIFSIYINRFVEFEKAMFKGVLSLAKYYLTPDHAIKIVGKNEMVNIEELYDMSENDCDIKVEDIGSDLESRFGRIMTTNHVLQYAGSSMQPDQLGRIIKNLPYGDSDEIMDPMTITYDIAVNTIMTLDKGDLPVVEPPDLDYMINSISLRMAKPDFKYLDASIKMNYNNYMTVLKEMKSSLMLQEQQAQMGQVPAGGFLTTINASWTNPATGKVERIKAPSEAIAWLMSTLQRQGWMSQNLNSFSDNDKADMLSTMAGPQDQLQQIQPQADGGMNG